MNGISKNSPFTKLDKFDIETIVTKVRTLITQGKRKKATVAKKTQAYEEARMKNLSKKSADNPKLYTVWLSRFKINQSLPKFNTSDYMLL